MFGLPKLFRQTPRDAGLSGTPAPPPRAAPSVDVEEIKADIEATKAKARYWRGQVAPRSGRMMSSKVLWVPVILGLSLPWFLEPVTTVTTSIADASDFGLNYAAIGFGACVTGAVLAISLPGSERIRQWATTRTAGGFSAFSDLVFALTWSAVAQLAVLVLCGLSMVIGGDEQLLPANPKESHTLLLGASLAVFFYGVTQLVVLVQTVSQLGALIDLQERTSKGSGD